MKSRLKDHLRFLFPTNRRLLVNKSLKLVSLEKCKKILVVGSGNDPYRGLFPHPLEKYVRFDIKSYGGKTDVVGDILEAPFEDESFDCIIAIEVMEHLEDPFTFKKEVKRILQKDGLIVLTVPFMFHLHADPYDYWRPTIIALETLFEDFSDLSIRKQGNRLHVILDLLTTSFSNSLFLVPFRLVNHIINLLPISETSTAPSGYMLTARKK